MGEEKALAGLALLEEAVNTYDMPTATMLLAEPPRTREKLYEKVTAFYALLRESYPYCIRDDEGFEFFDENSNVVDYSWERKELTVSPVMFPPETRKPIAGLAGMISPEAPADVIIELPIGIKVPFLDVERVTYVWFKSHG